MFGFIIHFLIPFRFRCGNDENVCICQYCYADYYHGLATFQRTISLVARMVAYNIPTGGLKRRFFRIEITLLFFCKVTKQSL